MPRVFHALLGLLAAATTAHAQGIRNPGFEDALTAVGWNASGAAYTIAVTDTAHRGARALLISAPVVTPGSTGVVSQMVDATPYRGKWIRLRGYARGQANPGTGFLGFWLRVDRANQQHGFFDNMNDRPIAAADWQLFEIIGKVDDDAERLALGMLLSGSGRALIDDLTLDTIAAPIREAPRALSERGLQNLIAFARVFGYVRYFHPSSAGAITNWNALAAEGVRQVERARDSADLAKTLAKLFSGIAPSVVFGTSKAPAAKVQRPEQPVSKLSLVQWQHRGVGGGTIAQERYSSTRIMLPDTVTVPPPLLLSVSGVQVQVPSVLYSDSVGTWPRSMAAVLPMASVSADDRAVRLADVIIAWNIFQHFYPYFDVVAVDWPAVLSSALSQAATDEDAQGFLLTLRRMVAALKDGHGSVQLSRMPSSWAPPVLLTEIEKKLVVTTVASTELDIKVGDVVNTIDGRAAADTFAAAVALRSSATPQWAKAVAVNGFLLGERDSQLKVNVTGSNGMARDVVLRRTLRPGTLSEARPSEFTEIQPGIFYVDLTRVKDISPAAIGQLSGARGIIIDMRGYPTGAAMKLLPHLSEQRIQSAHWLIPLVTRPDHVDTTYVRSGRWDLAPQAPYLRAPKVILTDGRAISYAESIMGIVEAYKLGDIVGEPTAGTNGNINPFALPGGYTVFWTGMRVIKHDGSQHHGIGIKPTVPVSRTISGVRAGKDEQLERALQLLRPSL